MTSISINYIIQEDIDEEYFNKILNGCKSDKYDLSITFHDFSLQNKIKEYNKDSNIIVVSENYEDREDSQDIVLKNFTRYADSKMMTLVNDNVIFHNIDAIDFNIINDNPLIGFIYTDYNINGIRCFLKSHSPVSNFIAMPICFWRTSKLIENISDNTLATIYGGSLGIHIPKDICTIHKNE